MLESQDIILVPKGAEYHAVCRGLKKIKASKPRVIATGIGRSGLVKYLQDLKQSRGFPNKLERKVVMIGLAGSLSECYGVGSRVIYQGCGRKEGDYLPCDPDITANMAKLTGYPQVRALTSDRLIWRATEKRELGKRYGYEVVDMEGAIVLEKLIGVKVGMVRVISDEVGQNLPDLEGAIDLAGNLQPFPLARQMLTHPIASFYLIRGALRGLTILQQVAYRLCQSD